MKNHWLFAYRGKSSTRADAVLAVLAFVGLIGFWYSVAELEFVSQRFLPTPWNVVTALYTMLVEHDFLEGQDVDLERGDRTGQPVHVGRPPGVTAGAATAGKPADIPGPDAGWSPGTSGMGRKVAATGRR